MTRWQRDLVDRIMAGEQLVINIPRQHGRSALLRHLERNPPMNEITMNEIIPGRRYRHVNADGTPTSPDGPVTAVTGWLDHEGGTPHFFCRRPDGYPDIAWDISDIHEGSHWREEPESRIVRAFDVDRHTIDLICNDDGSVTWRPG